MSTKPRQPFHVRPATAADYEGVARVVCAAHPERPATAAELQNQDQRRDPLCHFARWIAVGAGEVIGYAHYTQYVDMYRPGKFWLDVAVLPRWQQQGAGTALYTALLAGLQPLAPTTLQAQVAADQEAGRRFLEQRGFVEQGRRWQSYLEVAAFDPQPFGDFAARLAARGITLRAYDELAKDPRRDEKLHELQWALDRDVPGLEPVTPMTLAQFCRQVVGNPSFVPDGTFVALHGDDYVGMSSFFANRGNNSLAIDLTGTRPPYRRQGIALGLKLQGVLYARQHGYSRIVVQNDAANQGMLALNERLGFVRQPALLQYVREDGLT